MPPSRLALGAKMRDASFVTTIAEIKEAIARLSPREYCELMAELHPSEDDEWDKQMKADVEKAQREGTLIPLERILAEDEAGE